jgi:hypothetical protein
MKKLTNVFLLLVLLSLSSCNSNNSKSSKTNSSDPNGTYSDFSGWFSGVSGSFNVNSSTFSGYINDNNNIERYSGRTIGKDLVQEVEGTGQEVKIGYISGDKLYIWYLGNYQPIGK